MDIILCLLYIAILGALFIISKQILHKIQGLPPSPILCLPIIGHLHLFLFKQRPLHLPRILSEISARYGPVLFLRFGSRPVLVISSPSAAEECLSKNDAVFANRPHVLAGKILGKNYTTLIWSPYGSHWRNLRRIFSAFLGPSQHLSAFRTDEVQLLVRRLRERNNGKQQQQRQMVVDMTSQFQDLTFNLMMRMVDGRRYSGDEGANFREIVIETLRVYNAPNAVDFLPVMKWIAGQRVARRMTELQRKREGALQGLIDEYRRSSTAIETSDDSVGKDKTTTTIQMLLSLQKNEPEQYTDEFIRSMIMALIAGGVDSTATTMEWTMALLLNYPKLLKQAQNEIDNLVGQERLVEESDLNSLPFLRCIINEALRMYPFGSLLIPHESSEECTVGGYRIPSGTMLMINVWSIQNDPKLWDEPTEFKPERFQGVEAARIGFKFMPFGSGRRGCPGERFGLLTVGLAVASLIQCFDWERIGNDLVDMGEKQEVALHKAKPLLAKYQPRPSLIKPLSQI